MLVTLPIRLVNPLNRREHWAVRSKRNQEHRAIARMALTSRRDWRPEARPVHVTLTRISPRPFDGHDNAPAAFKSLVDGIADALGLSSDRADGVSWSYAWRRGPPKTHKVEILIEEEPTRPGAV